METKKVINLIARNIGFYISRKIDYPLVPPDTLQMNFLARCNLNCKICSIQNFKVYDKSYELSYETMANLIRQASRMEVKDILLLGGEPLLREDIFEIVKLIKKCNMTAVIVTNGTLMNEKMLNKIFESGLDNLHLSIDGATEKTFSAIRGEKLLGRIIKNVEMINKEKEKKGVNSPSMSSTCVITNQNLHELLKVTKLTQSLKMEGINFQPFVPDNSDQQKIDYSSPAWVPQNRYDLLDKAIDDLIKFKLSSKKNFDFISNTIPHLNMIKKYFRGELKKGDRNCYAGFNRLQITRNGTVYFCVEGKKGGGTAMGNIYKDRLDEIWYSKDARIFRKNIKKCNNVCLQFCSYRTDFDKIINGLHKIYYFGINSAKK